MTDIPVDKRAAEDAMRRKFRVLQTTWERARTYQNSGDGTVRQHGDRYHADALALENELVSLCLSATASEQRHEKLRMGLLNHGLEPEDYV